MKHGTYGGYIAGCRKREQCITQPTCTDAERRYQNQYHRDRAYGRPRKVPSIGTVRRIQALMALGWSRTYIAERLSMAPGNVPAHMHFETIRTGRAQQIRELYNELIASDIEGPSERTRTIARIHGFLPPQAWAEVDIDDPDAVPDYGFAYEEDDAAALLDEIAIERAIAGRPVVLTKDERLEAMRRMFENGMTVTEVAQRLRMGGARVHELRQRLQAS